MPVPTTIIIGGYVFHWRSVSLSDRPDIMDYWSFVPHLLQEYIWQEHDEFSLIFIGSNNGAPITSQRLIKAVKTLEGIPNLTGIVVNTHSAVWLPQWEGLIRRMLPSVKFMAVRIVSPHFQSIVARYGDNDCQFMTKSFAHIPFKNLGMECVVDSIPRLPYLRGLKIAPSQLPANEHGPLSVQRLRNLEWIMRRSPYLHHLEIPFDVFVEGCHYFRIPQESRKSLSWLAVTCPDTVMQEYTPFTMLGDSQAIVGLRDAVESLAALQKLTIPGALEHVSPLREALQRQWVKIGWEGALVTYSRVHYY